MSRENNMNSKTAFPFVKWVGGKRQLLPAITPYYENKRFSTYVEPFLGGGAVFFDAQQKKIAPEYYLSDMNLELITLYRMIQENTQGLIALLTEWQETYLSQDLETNKQQFYDRRNSFNVLKQEDSQTDDNRLLISALFIYLNKTCFNGLYRVNKKGTFNSPFGYHDRPKIVDIENLHNVHNALTGAHIDCQGYEESKSHIREGSFVYLDPPYRVLTRTAGFTGYDNTHSIDDAWQEELASFVRELHELGAFFVLSNSDPHNVDPDDNFFDRLYSDFVIHRIPARRAINSKGNRRGTIHELLITNITG